MPSPHFPRSQSDFHPRRFTKKEYYHSWQNRAGWGENKCRVNWLGKVWMVSSVLGILLGCLCSTMGRWLAPLDWRHFDAICPGSCMAAITATWIMVIDVEKTQIASVLGDYCMKQSRDGCALDPSVRIHSAVKHELKGYYRYRKSYWTTPCLPALECQLAEEGKQAWARNKYDHPLFSYVYMSMASLAGRSPVCMRLAELATWECWSASVFSTLS